MSDKEPLYRYRISRWDKRPTDFFIDFWYANTVIVYYRQYESMSNHWEVNLSINIYDKGVKDYVIGIGDTRHEAFQDARKELNKNPWRVHKSYATGLFDVYNIATKEYQHLGLTREKTALLYAQRLNEAQGA